MQGKANVADDLFAELDNFGRKEGSSADKRNRMPAQTPKENNYFQVGSVNHRNAMNKFLKEASEYDKMSNHSKGFGHKKSEDGSTPGPAQKPELTNMPSPVKATIKPAAKKLP